eukprot:SAG31_NODE_3181_length_4582_cov_2.306268_4_plen_114_part_00
MGDILCPTYSTKVNIWRLWQYFFVTAHKSCLLVIIITATRRSVLLALVAARPATAEWRVESKVNVLQSRTTNSGNELAWLRGATAIPCIAGIAQTNCECRARNYVPFESRCGP